MTQNHPHDHFRTTRTVSLCIAAALTLLTAGACDVEEEIQESIFEEDDSEFRAGLGGAAEDALVDWGGQDVTCGTVCPIGQHALAKPRCNEECPATPWGPNCGEGGSWGPSVVCVDDPPGCAPNEYQYNNACAPKPTVTVLSDDGSTCGDIGTAHPAPGYLVRTTITGRPFAWAHIYNQHLSCGDPPVEAPESPVQLNAFGSAVLPLPLDPGLDDCFLGNIYGRWGKRVVVDGQTSNTASFRFYNTACAGNLEWCIAMNNYCAG